MRSALPLLRILACAALIWSCSHQGEGQRCDENNGNLDCEAGLYCKSGTQLSAEFHGTGIALCCPINEQAATVDACRAGGQLPPDQSFTPPPDAGSTPADAAAAAP